MASSKPSGAAKAQDTKAGASILLIPDEGPTTDYLSIEESLSKFSAAFEATATRVSNGADSAKHAQTFLERWQRLEATYVRGMEELLDSRAARMNKNSTTGPSLEPVPQLRDAWETFVEELREATTIRKAVAAAVKDTVARKLALFNDKLSQRQELLLAEARKVLNEIKTASATLTVKQKRYIELCKNAAENVTLVAPAYEPATKAELLETLKGYAKSTVESTGITGKTELDPAKMTPPQRRRMAARVAQLESPSVREILEDMKKETDEIKRATTLASARSHVAFGEFLPSILNTLHDSEIDRVSFVKHAIGHVATGIVSTSRRGMFEATRAKIDHVTSDHIKTCVVNERVPPPPDFSHVNWDELLDEDVLRVAEAEAAILHDGDDLMVKEGEADELLSRERRRSVEALVLTSPPFEGDAEPGSPTPEDYVYTEKAKFAVMSPAANVSGLMRVTTMHGVGEAPTQPDIAAPTSGDSTAVVDEETISRAESRESLTEESGHRRSMSEGIRMWWSAKRKPKTSAVPATSPMPPPPGAPLSPERQVKSPEARLRKHTDDPTLTPPIFKQGRQLSSPYFDPVLTPKSPGPQSVTSPTSLRHQQSLPPTREEQRPPKMGAPTSPESGVI